MPSGRQELRNKYMTNVEDGITKCENIIKRAGGNVSDDFLITEPPNLDELPEEKKAEICDAIEYLITEWDYGYE